MALLANMGPPSYLVKIPAGREPVYQLVGAVFVAIALAAGGVWLARHGQLRAKTRRVLLWLVAGGLAVSYACWWVLDHHDQLVEHQNWEDRLAAMFMPGLCILVILSVLVSVGWGRGDEESKMRVGGNSAKPVAATTPPDASSGTKS
jgi:hypothetical protein